MSKPKKLSILGTYVSRMDVTKDDQEVLFFSINSFSEISYNSLDIEDFFSREDFEGSIDLFNESLIKLLKKIDENLKTCNIEGSFFDSGFWLTHRFSDIYFLHSLTEQINSLYEDVNLYVPDNYAKLNIEKCSLKDFSFAIIIGVLVGTYSSIFVASPVVAFWAKWRKINLRREILDAEQETVEPAAATN